MKKEKSCAVIGLIEYCLEILVNIFKDVVELHKPMSHSYETIRALIEHDRSEMLPEEMVKNAVLTSDELHDLLRLIIKHNEKWRQQHEINKYNQLLLGKRFKEQCQHKWQSEPDGGHGSKWCTKCDWVDYY